MRWLPAGPTTSTRMDKFTDNILENTGLLGMIGKAERGPVAIEAIRKHKAVYLMAVGGATLFRRRLLTLRLSLLKIWVWKDLCVYGQRHARKRCCRC